jgi:23S rRNA pseudouridine2604 synthase
LSEDSPPRGHKPARSGFKAPKQSVAEKNAARSFAPAPARERSTGPRPPRPDAAPAREDAPPSGVARRLAEAQRSSERSAQRATPRAEQRPSSVAPTAELPLAAAQSDNAGENTSARRPPKEPPRLSRRMSELGLCSRREADEWIENGWVLVDGVVINTLGARVHPKAKFEIKAAASKHTSEAVTILLNKPADLPCEPLEDGKSAALALIHPSKRWSEDESTSSFKPTHLRRLALAGKLDADASGMLIFTQEGSVARRVTGDDARLEKEYQVRVKGELTADGLEKLRYGLSLDDVRLKPAQVSWQNEEQLRFVLRENRPRQIQRMCELVGLMVVGVKRIRVGSVSLGKLPAGQWRYLRDNERF